MEREFIHLSLFDKKWIENFSDDKLKELQEEILSNPKKGDVLQGTSGIRKLRFRISGKGKSGGIRVFYLDVEKLSKTYLITFLKKSEKENLTKHERNQLSILVNKLKKEK